MARPYFDRNGIALYLGDCREILPTLPEKCAGLVLTDPPFESEAHTLQRRVNRDSRTRGTASHDEGCKIVSEALPFAPIDEATRTLVGVEIGRLASRWALVFCQIEAAGAWRAALGALEYKRTCIWVKPDGMPQYSGDRPGMGYEAIVAAHAPGRSAWNGGGTHGVFVYNKNETTAAKAPHPTTKPQRLMRRLVDLFSDRGDLVLDPFAGSGSTLIAAYGLGRRAIGIELEERYCEIAAKRLEREMAQLSLFKPAEVANGR